MLTELKYLRKDGERQSAAKSPGRRQPLASGLPCGPMCLRACESPRAAQRFKMILALVALDARIHPSPRKSFGSEPDFPFIFDRFRQGDSSKARRHGGLGLGLAISRHLVELHGGTIRAQSAGRSQGSTFRVTIPVPIELRNSAQGSGRIQPNIRAAEWTVPNLSGLSVLVVDDHSDARMLVERMLEGSGAEILLAASAKRALDICKRQKIDILISDLGMPEMDGLEMIRQMRAREDGRSLMAIAVTAFAHLEDRQAALRQGFDFLATKPVDAGELMLLVGKCVSRLRRHIQN